MSMISSQIDALRRAAQNYRDLGKHEAEQMLLDAADTIWQLRDDLQRANAENAKLREENERFVIKLNAEHIVRQNVESENAKLRELVRDMWNDGMCDCDERDGCAGCEYHYLDRMCELGIEVDE